MSGDKIDSQLQSKLFPTVNFLFSFKRNVFYIDACLLRKNDPLRELCSKKLSQSEADTRIKHDKLFGTIWPQIVAVLIKSIITN